MDNKRIVSATTISLFVAGIVIVLLLLYQNVTKPESISKQEAIGIALAEVDKEPNRSLSLLPNEHAVAKLVHVTDEGMEFFVDEDSMSDMWLFSMDRFDIEYENRYFWHVNVVTSGDTGSRGYWYLVDAISGQAIGNDRSSTLFAAN